MPNFRPTGPDELMGNLRRIVENSPIAIAIFDREMHYLLHSQAYAEDFRLEEVDLIGRYHYEVFPELPQYYRDVHQRCLAGATESRRADPFVRQDGRVEWTNWHVHPWYTSTGDIGGIVVMSEVITGEKEAELERRRAQERLEEAQKLARVGYWEYDIASDQLSGSQALLRVGGTELRCRRDYLRIVPADERPYVIAQLREAVAEQGPFYLEHAVDRHGPGPRYVAVSGCVLSDEEGRPIRMHGAFQDISRQRGLQEQLWESQKMQAVGSLAGGVAHDLNNILTAVFSFGHFALDSLEADHPAAEDIREVLKAAERASSLTQQLLAFSRRKTVVPRVLQINHQVVSVDSMLRRLLGEDISYATHLSDDLWRTRIDPNALEQVIVNLAVNARDALPKGGRITIETTNARLTEARVGAKSEPIPAGDYVCFILSDDGEGMTPEVLDQIFDPFYTTKPVGSGTGLGLSTCHGIVRQAGGYLWVYSEPGHGTTFKVFLPRVLDPLDDVAADAVTTSAGGHEYVLVVEDDEQVRELTVRTLRQQGYRVRAYEIPADALEDSVDETFDLLITDVILPGLNGRELAERVVAQHPEIRVLYISGYSENTVVHHGVLEEGVRLLSKPFSPADLERHVREALDAT